MACNSSEGENSELFSKWESAWGLLENVVWTSSNLQVDIQKKKQIVFSLPVLPGQQELQRRHEAMTLAGQGGKWVLSWHLAFVSGWSAGFVACLHSRMHSLQPY